MEYWGQRVVSGSGKEEIQKELMAKMWSCWASIHHRLHLGAGLLKPKDDQVQRPISNGLSFSLKAREAG